MRSVGFWFLIACFTAFACRHDNGSNGAGGSSGAGGVAGSGGNGGEGGFAGGGGSNPFDTRILDLSGFVRFRIDQTEALTPGGCPIPYLVDPAEIELVREGEYLLTFSAAFSSEGEYLRCLEQAEDPDDCDFAPPLPGEPRTLGDADLAELMALFSSMPVNFAPNPCEGMSVDQCNIIRIEWDDLGTSDRICDNPGPWIQIAVASSVLEAVTEVALPQTR